MDFGCTDIKASKLIKCTLKTTQKAEKALMFYKGCSGKSEREKSDLREEFNRIKSIEEQRRNDSKIKLKDFCNKMALKGIATSLVMAWFPQTTGVFVITNYASSIFRNSGSALSVEVSTILLAIAQIFGGLVSTQLGDAFGRKATMLLSMLGSSVGLFIFAAYSYMQQNGFDVSNYLWLPVICLSFVMFISSAGIVALCNTCVVENFPPKVSKYFHYK